MAEAGSHAVALGRIIAFSDLILQLVKVGYGYLAVLTQKLFYVERVLPRSEAPVYLNVLLVQTAQHRQHALGIFEIRIIGNAYARNE